MKVISEVLQKKREKLPIKAARVSWLQIYWVQAATHCRFTDNELRKKFNLCLESVVRQSSNMRVIKFNDHWPLIDDTLVYNSGIISESGKEAYWRAFDSSVEFNILKREQFLKKQKGTQFKKVTLKKGDQEDDMKNFFHHHKVDDFRRPAGRRFALPQINHH